MNLRLTRELVQDGWTHKELRRAERGDAPVRRVRRSAYVVGADGEEEPDAERRHRERVEATVRLSQVDSVLSHHSAALLHGMPTWDDYLEKVTITRARRSGGRIGGPVHLRTAGLPLHHVVSVDGRRVTSPARTVVDLARVLPHARAVAVGDHALHHELLVPEQLAEVLDVCQVWPGIGRARRTVRALDGRSESVGESVSRVVLAAQGVPTPELQQELVDAEGEVHRVDFCWPELRTVGEFDGMVKYGRLLRPGEDAADVVVREKLREDAIRDLDWKVARWTWRDLSRPDALRRRLERAFARR